MTPIHRSALPCEQPAPKEPTLSWINPSPIPARGRIGVVANDLNIDDGLGDGVIVRSFEACPGRCQDDLPPEPRFTRGDCNEDGEVDISDAVCVLNWLFLSSEAPGCVAALNANGDEDVDIADPVYSLRFSFLGGPAPVEPYPECGPATLPADEAIRCETANNCQE